MSTGAVVYVHLSWWHLKSYFFSVLFAGLKKGILFYFMFIICRRETAANYNCAFYVPFLSYLFASFHLIRFF